MRDRKNINISALSHEKGLISILRWSMVWLI